MNEFTFIQSKLDEVKYQIQTSATSTPPGNASPKVGVNQQSFDDVLSVDEQKELEKQVNSFICTSSNCSFSLAINRSFGHVFRRFIIDQQESSQSRYSSTTIQTHSMQTGSVRFSSQSSDISIVG